ncbi:MAG: N-acetylmuramoyl-L-alanine amidase [Polyangiaceae bacterium]
MRRWLTMPLLVALSGCPEASTSESAAEAPQGSVEADMALAAGYLAPDRRLPDRAQVVALSDRLGIAASARGEGEATAVAQEARRLAAALRERAWRFDRAAADAREAIELYGALVRDQLGTAAGCLADVARARLMGELAGDAASSYRAIYLALERQSAQGAEDEAREACVRELRAMLTTAEAYRPSGAAWDALEQEARSLASRQLSTASPTAPLAPSAAASASATPAAPTIEEAVVVVPDDSLIGKERVSLTKVQHYSAELGGRVVLHLSGPAKYTTGMLAPDPEHGRGHRLYLDLERTRIKASDPEAGKGLVQQVRLGKHQGGNARVVIDLAAAVTRRVFYLPDPFRVVIDVAAEREAAAPPTGGKRGVRRVALDPGHGGWDAGAIGPTGLREKDVALDVAHRAAPALAGELGIETMLTRDTDVFIELDERTARANAFQSDLFVSIHCNATENGQATGVEIYILDPNREMDRRALESVARENHARRGRMDPQMLGSTLTNIAAGLGMRTSNDSAVFADLLRRATLGSVQTRFPDTVDHGVKTAGFFVLVGAAMPAVLYETAFISNPEDEARLGTADYRQKLADAIVNAVKAYDEGVN